MLRNKRKAYRCHAPSCTVTGLLDKDTAVSQARLCIPCYTERKANGCNCANMRGDHGQPYACHSCAKSVGLTPLTPPRRGYVGPPVFRGVSCRAIG